MALLYGTWMRAILAALFARPSVYGTESSKPAGQCEHIGVLYIEQDVRIWPSHRRYEPNANMKSSAAEHALRVAAELCSIRTRP